MDLHINPFSVLTLIVAPALLTNASTIVVLSTGNRLARAVDRARELSKQLEDEVDLTSSEAIRRLGELTATEQRSLMLSVALRSFYIALGSFASAALVSLFGAVIAPLGAGALVRVLEVCGVVAGLVAVSALIYGSVVLMRETRIIVKVLQERAASVRPIAESTCPGTRFGSFRSPVRISRLPSGCAERIAASARDERRVGKPG